MVDGPRHRALQRRAARSSPPTTSARTATRGCATASSKATRSNARCTRASSTCATAQPTCAPVTEAIRRYPVKIEGGRVLPVRSSLIRRPSEPPRDDRHRRRRPGRRLGCPDLAHRRLQGPRRPDRRRAASARTSARRCPRRCLSGEAHADTAYLQKAEAFDALEVDWRPNVTASAIDATARQLRLADGESIGYDKLILCTGGRARTPEHSRRRPAGRYTLRSLQDAATLGAALVAGKRLLVIGGGWIGLEVAATARKKGLEVTVVEAMGRLCERTVPAEISDLPAAPAYLAMACGSSSAPASSDWPRRRDGSSATLSDGREIGMRRRARRRRPDRQRRTRARRPGSACDGGICVDAQCRSSDPDILAAGDVAVWHSEWAGRRMRLESWQNAQEQGIAAARSALGTRSQSPAAAVVLVRPVRRQPADLRHADARAPGRRPRRSGLECLRDVLPRWRTRRRGTGPELGARPALRAAPDRAPQQRRSRPACRSSGSARQACGRFTLFFFGKRHDHDLSLDSSRRPVAAGARQVRAPARQPPVLRRPQLPRACGRDGHAGRQVASKRPSTSPRARRRWWSPARPWPIRRRPRTTTTRWNWWW